MPGSSVWSIDGIGTLGVAYAQPAAVGSTTMVTKGETIEDALAQAEAARERLEAALAEAEAALINTVSDTANIVDANWADANVKVEKARARCRQLRAALVDRDHANRITRSRVRSDAGIKQSEELPKQELAASPPAIQPRDHALAGESKRSQDESRRRNPIQRFRMFFSGEELNPKDARARSTLIRQAIEFLGLVLAYLLYFHIDVQLRILRLLSIISVWARH
jgi:hypothetical protein